MNIEQIAQEVAQETDWKDAAEFLRRCLSKLAEQDVEPVGEVTHRAFGYVKWARERPEIGTKLYTETQLLAAQQRTAEACVKLIDDEDIAPTDDACGVAVVVSEKIRNGEWREYL